MNVFIARDGEILGEYPRRDLEKWARAGNLDPYDDYWHEGMEDWRPLPDLLGMAAWEPAVPPTKPHSATPPLDRRIILGGLAAAVVVFAILAFLLIKPDRSGNQIAATHVMPPPDAPTADQVMEKAAADLRERIERLPATAEPPLNTFYYDVRVNMDKTVLPRSPWSATVHGWENVVDPATGNTLSRTEFILTTNYEDGEWVYKRYHASVTNLVDASVAERVDDEKTPIPPSLVGALGLKRCGMSIAPQPTVSKVPGF